MQEVRRLPPRARLVYGCCASPENLAHGRTPELRLEHVRCRGGRRTWGEEKQHQLVARTMACGEEQQWLGIGVWEEEQQQHSTTASGLRDEI